MVNVIGLNEISRDFSWTSRGLHRGFFVTFFRASFNGKTVQIVAEQRELPGECLQNAGSPNGLRRFRYFTGRSLNGIAFNGKPQASVLSGARRCLRLAVEQYLKTIKSENRSRHGAVQLGGCLELIVSRDLRRKSAELVVGLLAQDHVTRDAQAINGILSDEHPSSGAFVAVPKSFAMRGNQSRCAH